MPSRYKRKPKSKRKHKKLFNQHVQAEILSVKKLQHAKLYCIEQLNMLSPYFGTSVFNDFITLLPDNLMNLFTASILFTLANPIEPACITSFIFTFMKYYTEQFKVNIDYAMFNTNIQNLTKILIVISYIIILSIGFNQPLLTSALNLIFMNYFKYISQQCKLIFGIDKDNALLKNAVFNVLLQITSVVFSGITMNAENILHDLVLKIYKNKIINFEDHILKSIFLTEDSIELKVHNVV